MKQLILTFFAVILCYSLFFDNNGKEKPAVDEINYIYEDAFIPNLYFRAPDTLNYFALYDNCPIGWNSEIPESGEMILLK